MRIKDFEKARDLADQREQTKNMLARLEPNIQLIHLKRNKDAYRTDGIQIDSEDVCKLVRSVIKDHYNMKLETLTYKLLQLGVVND